MKERTEILYDETGDLLEIFIGKPTECYYDKIGDDALVRKDEKTSEIKGFMMIAFKKILEKSSNTQYDAEKDILYVRVGEYLNCSYKELGDGVFVWVHEKTKEPLGFKVDHFKRRLIKLNFHDLPKEEIAVQQEEF